MSGPVGSRTDDLQLTPLQQNQILAVLLLTALAVRVAASLYFPAPHHYDEVFQSFEQAHRWAFGSGIVTWEYRVGSRSPVLPGFLAAFFRLAEPWVGGPLGYLVAARVLLCGLSLFAVAAVYRMGQRESTVHAIIAGFVAATWFEIVYFAGRPLTEAVATPFLLIALSLATPLDMSPSKRRLILIGSCLALCLLLRLQLAPALLICAAIVARSHFFRWWWMAAGGLVPLVVFGAADWYVWGAPFISYWRSIVANVIEGRASMYGEMPAGAYVSTILGPLWAGASAAIFVLCMLRWRKSLLWVAAALAIIASHTLIPHKEYRFVFPATACLIIVAALSSADVLRLAMRHLPVRFDVATGVRLTCLIWLVSSASLGVSPGYRSLRLDRAPFEAQLAAADIPDLCGLMVYLGHWGAFGGQTYLHRDVPMYFLPAPSVKITSTAPAFNVILAASYSAPLIPSDFREHACFDSSNGFDTVAGKPLSVCLFKRAGTCVPNVDIDVQRYLIDNGE